MPSIAPKIKIALFGECMIELRGEMFGTMQQNFGGDTLNTAVYLARLANAETADSVAVAYATQLGTDAYSNAMVAAWKAEGIDTRFVRREAAKMPGLYTIQVDEHGERTFFYWRDSSAAKDYFQDKSSPLEDAVNDLDAFYYSGISLAVLAAPHRDRLLSFVDRLRARGARVIFDSNFRPRLWRDLSDARQWYDRAFAVADIALITLDDHRMLYGTSDDAVSEAAALALTCPEVVIKRGTDPTLVRIAGTTPVVVPTFRVPKVVDTTGAGDAFAGGYLAARLQGQSAEVAARCGNKIASIVVQHAGAIIPREFMPIFFFG